MIDIVQKIIDNTDNFTTGRRGNTIKGIVLHTEGASKIEGTADRSLYNWFNTNSRNVSAHYYVTFSGKVEQYVLDNNTAHQAGNWTVNLQTIGIEHQDNGYYRPGEQKYTDEEYEGSAQLVAYLCQKYDIPVEFVEDISVQPGITIHKDVPHASTSCPNGLDWDRVINRAKELVHPPPAARRAAAARAAQPLAATAVESLTYPLRGLHDEDAADWMLNKHVRGWAVETVYANGDLTNPQPQDFRAHANNDIRVIIRWSYSYGTDAGGAGTFPSQNLYDEFVDWCAKSIKGSKGVWGHIIGNEPNRSAERPIPTVAITAGNVIDIYNRIWAKLGTANVRLSPPALDPTNVETGDPKPYWQAILNGIQGADFFALHAISYGSNQQIDDPVKFANAPLEWQFHSFRMWQPLADVIRNQFPAYRNRPLIITETNHLFHRNNPQQFGWDDDADQWIHRMYEYLAAWNVASNHQYVYGACLYRFNGDQWMISDKSRLLAALVEAGEHAR